MPAEGRPDTELVVRSASVIGNYDYLIDYRFRQNGEIHINIGATGQNAVKGVASASMDDPSAAADTAHGMLVAPNLVAPFHDHYFNFRLDFDVDGPVNHPAVLEVVAGEPAPGSPRRSFWTVRHSAPASELEARYTLSAMAPKYFLVTNKAVRTPLGHHPAYMIHHGSVAYGPFDYAGDPPMRRNAYVEYTIWNTVHDPGPALRWRRVPDAERRLGHAGGVGQGRPVCAGCGRGDVVHCRLPPPAQGGGLAGDVDRLEDHPHPSVQLLHPEPRADPPGRVGAVASRSDPDPRPAERSSAVPVDRCRMEHSGSFTKIIDHFRRWCAREPLRPFLTESVSHASHGHFWGGKRGARSRRRRHFVRERPSAIFRRRLHGCGVCTPHGRKGDRYRRIYRSLYHPLPVVFPSRSGTWYATDAGLREASAFVPVKSRVKTATWRWLTLLTLFLVPSKRKSNGKDLDSALREPHEPGVTQGTMEARNTRAGAGLTPGKASGSIDTIAWRGNYPRQGRIWRQR